MMKFKKLMFLSLIFIFLFSLSFSVLAQYDDRAGQAWEFTQNIMKYFNQATTWIFGGAGTETIVYLAVFIILAIMFSDALLMFSPMSRRASIAVGILLAIITAVMRGIKVSVDFLFGWTAILGTAGMLLSLLIVFAAYFLAHIFIFKWVFSGLWNLKKGRTRKARQAGIKRGGEFLEDIGEWIGGRKKP